VIVEFEVVASGLACPKGPVMLANSELRLHFDPSA